MIVRVLFFAGLHDLTGKREQEYELTESSTLFDLRERILLDYPAMAEMQGRMRIAVNEEYSNPDRDLESGDVVACIPPVSGG